MGNCRQHCTKQVQKIIVTQMKYLFKRNETCALYFCTRIKSSLNKNVFL